MWAVTGTKDIAQLRNRDAFLSVFLADSFDHQLINWIYNSWEALHFETGRKWHIAIPSEKSIHDTHDRRYDASTFSSHISYNLADYYGISRSLFPCLIFDDYLNGSKKWYLKLEKLESTKLKKFFRSTAQHIRHLEFEHMADKERWAFLNGVAIQHSINRLGRSAKALFGVAGSAASIVGLN